MKYILLFSILLSGGFVRAEQSCTLEWDGKVYRPYSLQDGEIAIDMKLKGHTTFRSIDTAGIIKDEYAEIYFNVLKFVPAEYVTGTCEFAGVSVWDRATTAVYFEASSDKPVFGSPVDAASKKTVKSWGLCKC